MLKRINGGKPISSNPRKPGSIDLVKEIGAFAILGVIRFLEGYYLIVITKRSKVATIGLHNIYKVIHLT